MLHFLFTRTLQAALAFWLITILVFLLSRLSGNPVDVLMPEDATQAQIDAMISHWGLDRPLHVQYFNFLGNALQGDFGESIKWRGNSAIEVVLERLPATLQLGGLAVLISVIVGIPLGVMSAVGKGSALDAGSNIIALLGQSMPTFWLGIVLIWIFAVWLGWFPTSGYGGISHMVLPAIAMAWFQIAALTRLTRSAMLDVLDAEYIKFARLKGVPRWKIVWKHALRNAAIVPLTYFGILAGSILTGSIVIETVFAWPGTGWLAIEAIKGRDLPVVQAVVLLFAFVYIGLNLMVDTVYALVDPRIRQQ